MVSRRDSVQQESMVSRRVMVSRRDSVQESDGGVRAPMQGDAFTT